MKKNQSFLQKVGVVLNTSSETFMLIALVGLFALPFVIAKNLEPVVRENNATSRAIIRTNTASVEEDEAPVAQVDEPAVPANTNVLGVSTVNKALQITEDTVNLKYFDNSISTPGETKYALKVVTTQVFGKIPVFKLTNSSDVAKAYRFNVVDAVSQNPDGKFIFVDNTKYEVNSSTLPQVVNLQPNDTVTFSLMNSTSPMTDLTVIVEVVEEVAI
jgi:hypothetical protein